MDDKNNSWTYELSSKKKILDIKLGELIRYRDLLFLLVRRDFVAQYKQSVLGPLWFFMQPLMNTLVFTVIFGNIAKIPTDGMPSMLFYMAGTVIWSFFATVFNDVGLTFSNNANMFGKVYFPRLVVPLAITTNKIITFSIQFLLFVGFLIYFILIGSPVKPNMLIFALPIIILHIGLLGMGTGLIVSSLTIKYRDLRFLVTFGIQLWMYATPIVYPSSMIPHQWLWVYWINPMAPLVEFFRYAFLGSGQINFFFYSISLIESFVFILIGLVLFTRTEKDFIDRI